MRRKCNSQVTDSVSITVQLWEGAVLRKWKGGVDLQKEREVKCMEDRQGRGVWLVLVSEQVQHTEGRRGKKEERSRICNHGNTIPLMSGNRSSAVLAFELRSNSINKEMVCIIRAYCVPKETEEEKPVLFGRL